MTAPVCPSHEVLAAFRGDALDAHAYVDVLDHTSACPLCGAFLGRFDAVTQQLDALAAESVEVPDVAEAYDRLMRRISATHPESPAPDSWFDKVLTPAADYGRDLYGQSAPARVAVWTVGIVTIGWAVLSIVLFGWRLFRKTKTAGSPADLAPAT